MSRTLLFQGIKNDTYTLSDEGAARILRDINLKATKDRVNIIRYCYALQRTFTFDDIALQFRESYHRTSIYRSLNLLCTAGIFTRLIDANGKAYYIYNDHPEGKPESRIQYFKCTGCNQLHRLPALPRRYFTGKPVHSVTSVRLIIEGKCTLCNSS